MKNKKRTLTSCTAFVIAAAIATATVAEAASPWRLSLSGDYSTGDYGSDEATDISSTSLQVRYKYGRWRLRGSIPYLRISGPASVVGLEGDPAAGVSTAKRTDSGLGDTILAASYAVLYDVDSGLGFSAQAKVKLPTADESKGLGTGETDWFAELKPFYVSGAATWFGTLGYKIYGDPPETDYRNVWYGSGGLQWRHSDVLSLGFLGSARERVTATSDSRRSVMLFGSLRAAENTKLQVYVLKGFGESAADWGSGLSLQREF